MGADNKIFVAGHTGLVGSATLRVLRRTGHTNIVTPDRAALDLTDQAAVDRFMAAERPDQLFLCAGKVGGIKANATQRATFIRDNLYISANVIDAAFRHQVGKILVLGSSCVYPRLSPQPMREAYLMTGPLEPTNEPYAVAKLAGMSMARAFHDQFGMRVVLAIAANAYGPGDNFDENDSHVIPALVRRFHQAKIAGAAEVAIWGSGQPVRDFIFVDDLADALVQLMQSREDPNPINIGTGEGVTVAALAAAVAQVVGYQGRIAYDTTKPDGMPKKILEVSGILGLGWKPQRDLRSGLQQTYEWYLENIASRARQVPAR